MWFQIKWFLYIHLLGTSTLLSINFEIVAVISTILSFDVVLITYIFKCDLTILAIRNLPKESHGEIQIVETDFSVWNRFSCCDSWAKFLMANIKIIS